MIVKCIDIINPNTGEREENNEWLRRNDHYVILEFYPQSSLDGIDFRIIPAEKIGTVIESAKQFELISDYIPSNWSVDYINGKYVDFSPRSWHKGNFWEAYFDDEQWALDLYDKEVKLMIEEEKQYLKEHNKEVYDQIDFSILY